MMKTIRTDIKDLWGSSIVVDFLLNIRSINAESFKGIPKIIGGFSRAHLPKLLIINF